MMPMETKAEAGPVVDQECDDQACVVCAASLVAAEGVVARWPFCHHDVCKDCVQKLDVCPLCRGPGRSGFADMFPTVRPLDALRALPDCVVASSNDSEDPHQRLVILEAMAREAGKASEEDIRRLVKPGVWVRRLLTALFLDLPVLIGALPHASLLPWLPRMYAGWYVVLDETLPGGPSVAGKLMAVMLRVWNTRLTEVEARAESTIEQALSSDQLRGLPDWALAEMLMAWRDSPVSHSPVSANAWDRLLASAASMLGPVTKFRYIMAAFGHPDQFAQTKTIGLCGHTQGVMRRLSAALRGSDLDTNRVYCRVCNAWSLCLELLLAEHAVPRLVLRGERTVGCLLAYVIELMSQVQAETCVCKCKSKLGLLALVAKRSLRLAQRVLDHGRNHAPPGADLALLSAAHKAARFWLHHANGEALVAAKPFVSSYLQELSRIPEPRAEPAIAVQVVGAWLLGVAVGLAPCTRQLWRLGAVVGDVAVPVRDPEESATLSTYEAATSLITGRKALFSLPDRCLLQIAGPGWGCLGETARAVLVSRGRLPVAFLPSVSARWRGDLAVLVLDPKCPVELIRMGLEDPQAHPAALHAASRRGATAALLPSFPKSLADPTPACRNGWLRAICRNSSGAQQQVQISAPEGQFWLARACCFYTPLDPGTQLLRSALARRQGSPGLQTALFAHAALAHLPVGAQSWDAEDTNCELLVKQKSPARQPPAGPLRWADLVCSRSAGLRGLLLLRARPHDDNYNNVCRVWRHVARAMYEEHWEPDDAARCLCPEPGLCACGLPVHVWSALQLAVRNGTSPTVAEEDARLTSAHPAFVALSARLKTAEEFAATCREEPRSCPFSNSLNGSAVLSAELWLGHRFLLDPARFQAWAATILRSLPPATAERTAAALRHLARTVTAKPELASADLACEIVYCDALSLAGTGTVRLPGACKKRLASLTETAIRRAIRSGVEPTTNRGVVDLGYGLSGYPIGLSVAIASWYGTDLPPAGADYAVGVLRQVKRTRRVTERGKLAARLLPCMLWMKACPVLLRAKPAANHSGPVFRREQAAMWGCGPVPWVVVADLPAVRLPPLFFGVPPGVSVAEFLRQAKHETRPLALAGSADWLVRIAAGGLRLAGWKPRTGTAFVEFNPAGELHHLKRRARSALVAWSRSKDSARDDAVVVLSALLVNRALGRRGPLVRVRDHARGVFAKVARRVAALRSPLLACMALAGRPVRGLDATRSVRRLKKVATTGCAGMLDRLECGGGWVELQAICTGATSQDRGGTGQHGFQSLSVMLHAAAVLGPPCLVAGSGMVSADHPSQNFALTAAWLEAVQSSAS